MTQNKGKQTYTKKRAYTARRGRNRYYRRKPQRRRHYRRRKRMNNATVSTMHPLIAPDRARVKLKYQQRISLSSTSGTMDEYLFRGNGPYDPDGSFGGGQPTGYDQWTALYKRYLCRASKIKIDLINVDGVINEAETCEFAVLPTPYQSFTPSDCQEIGALPYGKFTVADLHNSKDNLLSSYMSTAKIWGVSHGAVSSDNQYAALYNGLPLNQWYWNIYIQPANEVATETYTLYVTVTYYMEFWERKMLTPSLINRGMKWMSEEYDREQAERRKAKETAGLTKGDSPT